MSYPHSKHATSKGFTVIELLVITIVITILATITVVSYNGLRERAYNARVITSAGQWIKALKLYSRFSGGIYKDSTVTTSGGLYVCLGTSTSYPAITGYTANSCEWTGSAIGNYNTTFVSAVTGDVAPRDSPYTDSLSFSVNGTATRARGLLYGYTGDGTTMTASKLYYWLYGANTSCVIPEATASAAVTGAATQCEFDLSKDLKVTP